MNENNVGREAIPTLGDGDIRGAADGLLGFLHQVLVAVHGFCIDDLEGGRRLEETRTCKQRLILNLQLPSCLGFVFIATGKTK